MMAAPLPPRLDNIEIPDRPAVASQSEEPRFTRRRVILFGGIAAAALFFLVVIALLQSGGDEVARGPVEAPLIKAEGEFKVPPASRGGVEVPHLGVTAYHRLDGTLDNKKVIERLGPEAEQPEPPPAPPTWSEVAATPSASEAGSSLAPYRPGIEWLSEPPLPEPPAGPKGQIDTAPPAVAAQSKASPEPPTSQTQPPAPAPAKEPAKMPSPPATRAPATQAPATRAPATQAPATQAPATQAQVKVATAPANAPSTTEQDKPLSGKGFQLQLLSSRSADEAKGAWMRLKDKNGDLLGPLTPSVARADLGNRGTFYRLRAGPVASESRARSICDSLSARGVSCLVVRSSG
jgi:hypothetical protein